MFTSPVTPMEPKLFPHPFNSMEHVFQVKWDGVRILAFVTKDQVRLQNRKLHSRTGQYPEMQALAGQIRAGSVLLDGEMIALRNGKPSFSRILQRDLSRQEKNYLVQEVPVVYMVFDIIYHNGEEITALPWEERHRILEAALPPSDTVQIVENFFHCGKDFYQAIRKQKLEGMVAKKICSPYLAGQKSSHWLKIKTRRDLNCVAGGYVLEKGRLKSLLAGAYLDGRLRYLGRVGSGFSLADGEMLLRHLPQLTIKDPPFSPPPKNLPDRFWLQPALTMKVEFLEFTEGLQMRQPVIKGFLNIDPAECRLEQEEI